jgi:hypothetical protein
MTKYIIHKGTGTIIDADDGVYILDDDHLNDDEVANIFEPEDLLEFVDTKARRLQGDTLELHFTNTIAFSESAIKEEMSSDLMAPLAENIKDWVADFATHEDFEILASLILTDERIWSTYPEVLIDAINELHARRVKERVA